MPSPESRLNEADQDPRLTEILDRFGEVIVTAHGLTMAVQDAQTQCPPFIEALLRTESAEQLEQVINIYKA